MPTCLCYRTTPRGSKNSISRDRYVGAAGEGRDTGHLCPSRRVSDAAHTPEIDAVRPGAAGAAGAAGAGVVVARAAVAARAAAPALDLTVAGVCPAEGAGEANKAAAAVTACVAVEMGRVTGIT